MKFFTGLDLGQASEFTALAVLEQAKVPAPDAATVNHYEVRHLERFAMGTSYSDIASRTAKLFAQPPLKGSTLVVDRTIAGRPVMDLLRRTRMKARIQPVCIGTGHKATYRDGSGWMVPKMELISTLQVLLQTRRLRVAPGLKEASTLVAELVNFKLKPPADPQDPMTAWREGPHDDLVFAVGIAAWLGERMRTFNAWLLQEQP